MFKVGSSLLRISRTSSPKVNLNPIASYGMFSHEPDKVVNNQDVPSYSDYVTHSEHNVQHKEFDKIYKTLEYVSWSDKHRSKHSQDLYTKSSDTFKRRTAFAYTANAGKFRKIT